MFVTEEYDGVLYFSGGVYRRLAEAGDSEEYANKSLMALFEALTARTEEAAPLDHAHYRDRQLRPIAEAVADALGASADVWLGEAGQLALFATGPAPPPAARRP